MGCFRIKRAQIPQKGKKEVSGRRRNLLKINNLYSNFELYFGVIIASPPHNHKQKNKVRSSKGKAQKTYAGEKKKRCGKTNIS
tara:strand:+ start:704 stop:952 length:249 start_codon:yes stop_codon:yes gene_type:complete